MTKGLVSSLLLCMAASLGWTTPASAEAIDKERGRLAELIERLSSEQYVLAEPERDRRPYVEPASALHAFRHMAATLAWGDIQSAARQADALDYEIVEFTDVETERPYYVLREDLASIKQLRGWGSYIVNPHSRVEALVEVPHPMADEFTPEIGGLVFEKCQARGFLLAGSHRAKADVPDLVDSMFHQVHTAWIGPQAQVTAWQIHGFSSMKHAFPRGAQVVASTGNGTIVPEIAALDTVLEKRGLASYVFNELPAEAHENRQLNGGVPGVTFTSLAAAKNEQGRLSRSLGGSFVHIELEVDVRANAENRRLAGSAIAAVIREGAGRQVEAESGVRLASAEIPRGNREADDLAAAAQAAENKSVRVAAKPVSVERRSPRRGEGGPQGASLP